MARTGSTLLFLLAHPLLHQCSHIPLLIPFIVVINDLLRAGVGAALDFGPEVPAEVALARNVSEKMADV